MKQYAIGIGKDLITTRIKLVQAPSAGAAEYLGHHMCQKDEQVTFVTLAKSRKARKAS